LIYDGQFGFGPKSDEIIRRWRKLHNEELPNLYSPNITTMIKSKGMRWAEHITRIVGEEEYLQGFRGKARRKETTRKIKTYVGG
jgi:hypothetical protein